MLAVKSSLPAMPYKPRLGELSIPDVLHRTALGFGTRAAVQTPERTLTWRDLEADARRFAGYLSTAGVRPGEAVVWQLPNWWESLVVAYGIWVAGAVSVPVVPIFRQHELTQVLAAVRPACVIAPAEFRGVDHVDLFEACLTATGEAPGNRIVVRGSAPGWTTFDDALRSLPGSAVEIDPADPALIGFTSGTTAVAKGVVHDSSSFLSVSASVAPACGVRWDDVFYLSTPIAHAAGLVWGVGTQLVSGASVAVRPGWDAAQALRDITELGVTYSTGPALFLSELAGAAEAAGIARVPLRTGFTSGGSSLPDSIIERADRLGLRPLRGYGMTECPMVTMTRPFDPSEQRLRTDGRVTDHSEIRITGENGEELPPGSVGEIHVRGPQRCITYLDSTDNESFEQDGWFRSGDLGMLDGDGYLRVTGRIKDIINRGGEKFSAKEIEDLIAAHPSVAQIAVTAVPHERLGEQPAAFVVTREGMSVSDAELGQYLVAAGLASQKVPRIWRHVSDLPRTASGKVVKRGLSI